MPERVCICGHFERQHHSASYKALGLEGHCDGDVLAFPGDFDGEQRPSLETSCSCNHFYPADAEQLARWAPELERAS